MTIQEVADIMKVSEKTVLQLIKPGYLAGYKVKDRGQPRVKEHNFAGSEEAQRADVANTERPKWMSRESE